MLQNIDRDIKNSILNAITRDPGIITIFKEKYVDDEIWKYCISQEPSIFKKMKHPSYDICLYACEIDGMNLKYVVNKFSYINITAVMVFKAVRSNPNAILYVPKSMLSESLKEMAFDVNPSLMTRFSNIRKEYILSKLKENPIIIQYVIDKIDEDVVCDMIKQNPNICVYIDHMTSEMTKVLKENHPSYYALYKNNIGILE